MKKENQLMLIFNQSRPIHLLFLMLFAIFAVSAPAQLYPSGDLDQNFVVDFDDLIILAEQWLDESGCVPPDCAELDGIDRVTMGDFSILGQNWLVDYGLPLVINEFVASNNSIGGFADPQGQYDDWIELYNFGETAIDVGGLYLSDNLSEPTKWQFPTNRPGDTTIPSNGFLIVWADEDVTDTPGLHADFNLSAGGEEIGLFGADGATLIDSVSFSDQISNVSYGRWPDNSDELRYFATATHGAANADAYLGLVEDTKFSHNRGFYDAPFSLTITCATPGTAIYYTTDGSVPIESEAPSPTSIAYTGPISISSNACIRAGAIKTGWMPTNIDTHTYIFDATDSIKSLQVYSIVGDEQKSLYEPDGIMAIVGGTYGSNGWTSGGDPTAYNNPVQRGSTYERPVSFEILGPAGDNIQIDCGIRVQGSDYHRPRYTRGDDWNVDSNKFSFNIFFGSEYGDSDLDYPLFPLAGMNRYKSFTLRGGFNDIDNPFIKDELFRRLHQDMGGVAVTGTAVSFYLNGEYKSFFNPCGRLDDDFFRDYYDVDTDWDVITQSGVRDGDMTAWNATWNYMRTADLTNTVNYVQAGEMVDITDFIDYLIVELYSGNYDWVLNNWTASRERVPEGKFRFHCWDMELAMSPAPWAGISINTFGFDDLPHWDMKGLNGHNVPLAYIYRGLKTNPEFRLLFADRLQKHLFYDGTLTPASIEKRFNELRQQMSLVIPAMDTYALTTWIPQRGPLLLAECTRQNLFPSQGPDFKVNGISQHGGYVTTSDTITITETGPSGTIYYTTDGNDPRAGASIIVPAEPITVSDDAAKKVFVPAGDIGTGWRGGSEPYDDSSWISGTGGVGYERSTGYESMIGIDTETQMYNLATTCYIRIPFTIDGEDLPNYNTMQLRVRYDDGFIAYLNGTEVRRVNFSGTPQWNSTASIDNEATSAWNFYDISGYISSLREGDNIIAIHGLNRRTNSSDFLISVELELSGVIETVASISPSAIEYAGSFQFGQSTELKSRVLLPSGEWSALHEASYGVGPVAENLRISEIMYHPGDPNDEFIELVNTGSEPINLNLVRFTKGVDFTFGPELAAPNEYILLVRNLTHFMQRYPAFNGRIAGEYAGALDDAGENIRLRDAANTIIHEFSYKDGWYDITDGGGFSLTIRDPGSSDPNDWTIKEGWRPSAIAGGSPGQDDTGLLPDPGSVVINEVLAHSHTSAPDWIELHNTTDELINIGGWFLSDNNDDDPNLMKYQIPMGTSIEPYGYIVFYEDDHFGNPSAAGVNKPFSLSEGGEAVYLRSGINGVVGGYEASESFGASASGIAFGRYIKSTLDGGVNFVAMSENTPGEENAYPQVGPVVITEIMYNTEAVNMGDEYIELHNITGSSVTLQDSVSTETSPGVFRTDVIPWQFSDGIDFVFPTGTTIPAGGFVIIAADPAAFTGYYGTMPIGVNVIGPFQNGTALSNGGEQVQIVRPGDQEYGRERFWIRTERVTYDDVAPWPTSADGAGDSLHQRTPNTIGANYGNDVINWQAAAPTPGH